MAAQSIVVSVVPHSAGGGSVRDGREVGVDVKVGDEDDTRVRGDDMYEEFQVYDRQQAQ